MGIMNRLTTTLLLVSLVAGTAMGAEAPWVTDWEAAKAQAAKEQKTLLIDFSGSDWCGWCMKLEREVFSQEAFIEGAKDKYVMVLLDFPRDKSKQSAELQAQNNKLKDQFPVRGYPSVFLATADGVPFAQTGYQAGGAEPYLKHLAELQANHDEVLALKKKLDGAEGVERAKILDQLYTKTDMDSPEKATYPAEIIKLDADGKAGLKGKYQATEIMSEVMNLMRAGKRDEAAAACDKALAIEGLPVDSRQEILFVKSQTLFGAGDKKGAKAMLTEAAKLAPESELGKQIAEILKGHWFKDVE